MKTLKFQRSDYLSVLLIISPVFFILYSWNELPDKIPSHWNLNGEVDGYMSKLSGMIFSPIVAGGIFTLLYFIPLIDPKKENYQYFQSTLANIRLMFALFMTAIFFQIYAASLGVHIGDKMIKIAVPLLFAMLGNLMGKMRQNYFFGIRTPWTLENETVWNKTHRLTGKIWVYGSFALILLGFIIPNLYYWIAFVAVMVVLVVIPVVYSYLEYKKIKKVNKETISSAN